MSGNKGCRPVGLSILADFPLQDDEDQDWAANTYRKDGVSISASKARLFGKELEVEVEYSELEMGPRIGAGACSAVHIASHLHTGTKYAVKMFNAFDSSQTSQLTKELLALTKIDCEAIVRICGLWHKENRIALVLEYMDLGSLELLCFPRYSDLVLPESVLSAMTYQILWGMCYLHHEKTMHRDIKPANILLSSRGEIKLSDFGIASLMSGSTTIKMADTSVGTFKYMSPERLLGERYDASTDCWSLALTLIEVVLRCYPLEHCCASPIDLISELEIISWPNFLASYKRLLRQGEAREKDTIPDLEVPSFSPSFIEFLCSMLQNEPRDRLSTRSMLLDSPWLDESLGSPEVLAEQPAGALQYCQTIVRDWLVENNVSTTASQYPAINSRALALSTSGNPSPPKKGRAGVGDSPNEKEDDAKSCKRETASNRDEK